MSETVPERQHAVKEPTRPMRTPAGDAFTSVVVQVARLGGDFTASVAQIARGLGMARQSVQRVADLLVRDGLAVYKNNPDHQRAKLLTPTARGRRALRTISTAQKAWADALGAEIGEAELRRMSAVLERIQQVTSRNRP